MVGLLPAQGAAHGPGRDRKTRDFCRDLPWVAFFRECQQESCGQGTLYHDFEQTPRGDCGQGVECGEYLWNHSNGSMLTGFFVEEFVGGEQGMGSPYVDVRAQPPGARALVLVSLM